MSYFQHTKADLAEAKRETAEAFLALADDTSRKMDHEEFDRTYLLEDLITRIIEVAKGSGVTDILFLSLEVFDGGRTAYDVIPESGETTQDLSRFVGRVDMATVTPINREAMREAWENLTFDGGYPRHEHVGMADERCLANIRSVYNTTGPSVRCGRYFGHEIHNETYTAEENQP